MASLRDQILEAIATRMAGIDGWDVVFRDWQNTRTRVEDARVKCTVFDRRETKDARDQWFYTCRLSVHVVIVLPAEEGAGVANACRALDDEVVLAERALHAEPIDLGLPWVQELQIDGHEKELDDSAVGTELLLTVKYRHNIEDPEVYDPAPRIA